MMHSSRAPGPPTPAPRRAFAPDLARGLMLCLIAIANVSAYLWGTKAATMMSGHPPSDSPLDTTLSVLTILFVDGSIYPMFAFLFGYGIVQFTRSRTGTGKLNVTQWAGIHTVQELSTSGRSC